MGEVRTRKRKKEEKRKEPQFPKDYREFFVSLPLPTSHLVNKPFIRGKGGKGKGRRTARKLNKIFFEFPPKKNYNFYILIMTYLFFSESVTISRAILVNCNAIPISLAKDNVFESFIPNTRQHITPTELATH